MNGQLPEARLRPKDGADRRTILKAQARDGARTAGKVGGIAIRTIAVVAMSGAGLFAIGAGRSRSPDLDRLDRQMENLRRMNQSLQTMPKIDWDAYSRSLQTPKFDDRLYRNLDALKARGLDESLLRGDSWSLPKPTTPAPKSPVVRSQPPSAQQRATLAP